MNQSRNLSNILLIYQRPGEYMIPVDENIEVFIHLTHYMWFFFGPLSTIVNLTAFFVIFKVNQSQKIYYLIQVANIYRAIFGTIMACTYNTACLYCKSNFYNSLYVLIYKTYFVVHLGDILILPMGVTEILITYDRLSILKNNLNNFIARQDIKCVLPIVFCISIALHVPDFFILDFIPIDEGVYYREINPFGNSDYYNYVFAPIRIIASFALQVAYVKYVISLIISYREFLARKKRIQNKKTRVNKNENDLITMVLFQTCLHIVASFLSIISRQLGRVGVKIKDDNPTDYYVGWLIIIEGSFHFIALILINMADMAIFVFDSRIKELFQGKTPTSR